MMSARTLLALVLSAAPTAMLLGCGDESGTASDGSGQGTGDVSGEVTVLAAASLTEPFEELGEQLAEEYPDLNVTFSFGPSSGLAEQAASGAPADVLATASTETMDNAVDAEVVDGSPQVFARNTLVLAVPAGNPGDVSAIDDLARDELQVAVCEPQVPCGAAAETLLDEAAVTASPDTLTTGVKEATTLLSLGEVDAALIYRTDAATAGDDVETVDVAEADSVVNDYPVAALADAPNADGARVVVDAITGDLGKSLLGEAGFLEP